MPSRRRRLARRRWTRVLAAVALASAYLSWDASALFQGTLSESAAISSGQLKINIGAHGSVDNRLNIAATHMVLGDVAVRTVTLTTQGDVDFDDVTLTAEATTSSALDTDDGMLFLMTRCDIPFDEVQLGDIYVPQCNGNLDIVANLAPPTFADMSIGSYLDLTPGAPNYLALGYVLVGPGNDMQGLSSVIELTFKGVQRAGAYK